MPDVLLRPYEPVDAAPVLELNQGALDGVGWLDAERLDRLVGMASEVLVVADDAGVAGFAVVLPPGTAYDSVNYRWFGARYETFGYLDRIVVSPERRRRGVAGMLYDAAEDASRPAGRMVCEVYVEPPNGPSLAFHSGRGYTEVGRLLQANGKTCTMLVRELA